MTRKEFYGHLRACQDKFEWYRTSDGRIRAKHKNFRHCSICFCPITAVQFHLTNQAYDNCYWYEAAKQIGLNFKDNCSIIVLAADFNKVRRDKEYERKHKKVRGILLKITNPKKV